MRLEPRTSAVESVRTMALSEPGEGTGGQRGEEEEGRVDKGRK